MEQMWSDGRVARHSSAKAATAVRIRFRPLQKCATSYCGALFYYQSGIQRPIGTHAQPPKNKESHLAATLPQYPAKVAYVMQDIVFQRHAPKAYRYFPTLLAMNKLCALSITDNTPNGN